MNCRSILSVMSDNSHGVQLEQNHNTILILLFVLQSLKNKSTFYTKSIRHQSIGPHVHVLLCYAEYVQNNFL